MRRIVSYVVLILSGCAVLLLAFPQSANADGGAPNLAYVAGAGPGISVIDIGQKKVSDTFSLKGSPQSVYLSLDGRFLFVTQPTLNQVSMLTAKTGQLICTAHIAGSPSLLAYDPLTNSLFVAGNQTTSISNLDMTDCTVLHMFQTTAPVYGLAVANLTSNTQNNQLWVSNRSGLMAFDTQTRKELATIPLSGGPRYLCIPVGGSWVYVTTLQGDLDAVNIDSHTIRHLLSNSQFGTMDFNETTGEVYVPDSLHRQLDVITPPTLSATTGQREPTHVYALNATPESVAITSDGQFGFIALSTGQVAMLDIPGRQIVQTIDVGGGPHFIITGLYPPVLGTTPQQTSLVVTIATIGGYLLIIGCLLIPVWFVMRRNSKAR